MSFQLYSPKIAIIGLGYVGLPLATVFGKLHNVVGFDIDASRISELKEEQDRTGEVSSEDFKTSKHLRIYILDRRYQALQYFYYYRSYAD